MILSGVAASLREAVMQSKDLSINTKCLRRFFCGGKSRVLRPESILLSRGPSTSQTDSHGESVYCAQDDIFHVGSEVQLASRIFFIFLPTCNKIG